MVLLNSLEKYRRKDFLNAFSGADGMMKVEVRNSSCKEVSNDANTRPDDSGEIRFFLHIAKCSLTGSRRRRSVRLPLRMDQPA